MSELVLFDTHEIHEISTMDYNLQAVIYCY